MLNNRRSNRRMLWIPVLLFALVVISLTARKPGDAAERVAQSKYNPSNPLIDFSGYTGGPVEEWLKTQGFKLEKDAANRDLLGLSIHNAVLTLESKARMSGFIFTDSIDFDHVSKVRITWGVSQYPQNASYEKQVNNEALMLYIFFGTEKVSSGNVLIPNSPYFIGLFLCQNDQVNVPYKGRYFHTGGRFVCLGKPRPGEMIVSEFELDRAFKSYFGKNETPRITGLGFGIDTSQAGNGGKATALIKSVEFQEEPAKPSAANFH
jgi:hypothetical protein